MERSSAINLLAATACRRYVCAYAADLSWKFGAQLTASLDGAACLPASHGCVVAEAYNAMTKHL